MSACRSCVGGQFPAMLRTQNLGYLAAVTPAPDREALVGKLAIVMGEGEARKTGGNLEALVQKRASEGATKVVVGALWGFVALNVVGYMLRRRG